MTSDTNPINVHHMFEISLVISTSASVLSLSVLSMDRYSAMVHPMHYRSHDRKVRRIVTITLVWSISIVYPLITYHHQGHETMMFYFFNITILLGFLVLLLSSILIMLSPTTQQHGEEESVTSRLSRRFSVVSSEVVEVFSRSAMFSSCSKGREPHESREDVLTNHVYNKKPLKLGHTFALMIGQYVLCFLPPMMVVNYRSSGCAGAGSWRTLLDIVDVFVMVFITLNPFLYCWRQSNYCTALRSITACICKKDKKRKSSEQLCGENKKYEEIESKRQHNSYPKIVEDWEGEDGTKRPLVKNVQEKRESEKMKANEKENCGEEVEEERVKSRRQGEVAYSAQRKRGVYQKCHDKLKQSFSDPGVLLLYTPLDNSSSRNSTDDECE